MNEYLITIDETLIKKIFPLRDEHGHKGTFGKVLFIGGSDKMYGALALAAKAALHSGIGTLTLFLPDSLKGISERILEAMHIYAPSKDGYFAQGSSNLLETVIDNYDYVAIGNGMGRNESARELLKVALKSNKPLLIDADGLFHLKDCLIDLKRPYPVTITPHLKEFAVLNNLDVKEVMNDPLKSLKAFNQDHPNIITVLKSSATYISQKNAYYLLNKPQSALAKGGSGDVLCGIIAGLQAQSKDYLNGAIVGAYVHSLTASANYDPNYLTPSLMIEELNDLYKALRNQHGN